MERLQKIIAESGYCSRRKAEELIGSGRVSVNGIVVDTLGFKAELSDDIRIDGYALKKEEKVVYLLNKPKNVISSVGDDRGRIAVNELIDSPYRLYPIGRLDYDSTGLLLLSNDGELMQALTHPKNIVEKVYEVTVNKLLSRAEIEKLESGVYLEGRRTAPAKIRLLRSNENKNTSFLEISIHEGRNRQIRKMFETIGAQVIRLHRIREANIELGNLQPGEYRKLKPVEVVRLKKYLDRNDL